LPSSSTIRASDRHILSDALRATETESHGVDRQTRSGQRPTHSSVERHTAIRRAVMPVPQQSGRRHDRRAATADGRNAITPPCEKSTLRLMHPSRKGQPKGTRSLSGPPAFRHRHDRCPITSMKQVEPLQQFLTSVASDVYECPAAAQPAAAKNPLPFADNLHSYAAGAKPEAYRASRTY